MSPDPGAERILASAVDAAVRRARVLAVAEALAWGASIATISPAAGALLAAAQIGWRWRAVSRASILRAIERTHPDLQNLLITAEEITAGALAASPPVRARVLADAAAWVQRLRLAAAFPVRGLARAAIVAALAWTAVATAHLWRGQLSRAAAIMSRSTASSENGAAGRLRVTFTVIPPPYTGLKETTAIDPEQLQVVEGSALVLSIEASAARLSVQQDGRTLPLERGADGRLSGRLRATKTGYLLVTADSAEAPPMPTAKSGETAPKPSAKAGARRMVPLLVTPDALPAVRLTAPGRDLVYVGGNPRIAFDARATDDFGLRSFVLRYTKVTGSGENFEFLEGEIPLAIEPASARDWSGSASRSLAELNLQDGDMLVYRAVAADARPGDGSATSDAFFIEISKLGVAAGDAFTLPEEESKYALSQQMLIIKTERLHGRRASLPAGELAEQALNLAVEQRMIRAEFVFMLGGEIDDEEVEAEQSVELQAGRLQNRGQRDLRAATVAMSQAQKLLTGADTAQALIAERAAVAALQRAFSRQRYILRAMATRSQLDATRRLTGSLADAAGWRRMTVDAPANRRAALLQDLLRGIAELDASADERRRKGPGDAFEPRALLLAEEAIRIDPASTELRQAATELQRAAASSDSVVRAKAVAAAAAAAAAEGRRAQAAAPLASPVVAPALSGAFSDAMNARLKASRSGEREPR